MKCPACSSEMEEFAVADIKVDVCRRGCGGIWFDRFELQKVDEAHESAGEDLLDIEIDATVEVDHSERRSCPKCQNTVMMRHYFSIKREIEVDECPACAGMWIDHGEMKKIREQFATEVERDAAAEDRFSQMFDEELGRMKDKSEEELDRARKFARLLRFMCPSYYIPGKQGWGAF